MAIDTRKVIMAAVEAALDDVMSATQPDKRRRLRTGRAFLLGAGLVTAARLATGSRGRHLLESAQDRLADFEDRLSEDEDGEEESEDEEWEDEEWEEEPEEEYAEQS